MGRKKITLKDLDIRKDGSIYYKDMPKKCYKHTEGYIVTQCDGKAKYVHRLVAEKFLSNVEGKPVINHKNGIKDDNRVENLEWATYKENNNHARDKGLWGKNIMEKRKLTYEQAMNIKALYGKGTTFNMLSDRYNVDYRTIYDIVNNKSYLRKDY